MIKTFRHKGLAELWTIGRTARIDRKMHVRIMRRLDRLDAVARPEQMDLPGFDFHALKGFTPARFTVHINGPGRSLSSSAEAMRKPSILNSITNVTISGQGGPAR